MPPSGHQRKIAIGPSSFGQADPGVFDLLREAGCTYVINDTGRKLNPQETCALLEGCVGIIAGLEILDESIFQRFPELRVISRVGIGMDQIDLEAAQRHGITVLNTPDEPARAVAELTVTAMLCLSRNFQSLTRELGNRQWRKQLSPGLWGKVVHLVGFGRIGREVATLLTPFGCQLLITDPALDERALPPSSIGCSLAEGLAKADLISLHANTSTPLLGHREFNLMKTGAFLLNSARGHLVDHEACLLALKQKKLGGLWFDVFEEEPYQGPLCEEEGALLTPHVGTYTSECRQSMERRAVLHLLSCL